MHCEAMSHAGSLAAVDERWEGGVTDNDDRRRDVDRGLTQRVRYIGGQSGVCAPATHHTDEPQVLGDGKTRMGHVCNQQASAPPNV